MAGMDPGLGGTMAGSNDLQASIDALDSAVKANTTAIQGQSMGGGLSTAPAYSSAAEGATFSQGQFPKMQMPSVAGKGAVVVGSGEWNEMAGSYSGQSVQAKTLNDLATTATPAVEAPPTMGSQAAGGGANAGGATFATGASGVTTPVGQSTAVATVPSSPGTMNTIASGGGANGGGSSFGGSGTFSGAPIPPAGGGTGGGAGGGSGSGGGSTGGGGLGGGNSNLNAAVSGTMSYLQAAGTNQMGNMLYMNAYGNTMQAMYGGSAQQIQNATFGTGGTLNEMALNAQDAGSAYSMAAQQAGGIGNARFNAIYGGAQGAAFANQGIGATAATQLTSQIFSPETSLRMRQSGFGFTADTANGGAIGMSGVAAGLAQRFENTSLGKLSSQQISQMFSPNSAAGLSIMQGMGLNSQQMGLMQSNETMLNGLAKNGVTGTTAQNLISGAMSGNNDDMTKLSKESGVNVTTLQKIQNANAASTAQQNDQSGGFNQSVSDFADAVKDFQTVVNQLEKATGASGVIGAAKGVGAGSRLFGNSAAGKVGSALVGAGTGALEGAAVGSIVPGLGTGVGALIGGGMGAIQSLFGAQGGGATSTTTTSTTSQGSANGAAQSNANKEITTAIKDAEAQVGKPYQWGGDTPSTSFDCSGLVYWAYGQAGVHLPRTSQQQWAALKNKSVSLDKVQAGDIVFAAGSDGTATAPGHEALYVGNGQIVEAPQTGENIRIRGYSAGEWQHAARPVGNGSVASTGDGTSGSTKTSNAANQGNGGASSIGAINGGDSALAFTTNEADMLGGGGNVAPSGAPNTLTNNTSSTSSSAPAGSGATGSETQNGTTIYNYLLKNLFGGNKIAAAGAVGSIWGESTWNPEAVEDSSSPSSGGEGLIQWTPGGKYGVPITGNVQNDMDKQLPMIISYVDQGHQSAIGEMKSAKTVAAAADIWDQRVEVAGVSDVHATGVQTAAKIAGITGSQVGMSSGGTFIAGERGPEAVTITNGSKANIMNAKETSDLLRGTAAQAPQGVHTASPTAAYVLDRTLGLGATGTAGGAATTIQVSVAKGAINYTGSGATAGTAADTQTMADQLQQAIETSMAKSQLIQNIAAGKTG